MKNLLLRKKLVFMFSNVKLRDLEDVKKRGSQEGIKVVLIDENLGEKVAEKNIPAVLYKSYFTLDDGKRWHKEAMSCLYKWSEKEIAKGQTIKSSLIYERLVSLWWMIDHRDLFFLVKKSIRDLETIEGIIELEKPNEIILLGDSCALAQIIYLVAQNFGVQIMDKTNPPKTSVMSKVPEGFLLLGTGVFLLCAAYLRKIIYYLSGFRSKREDSKSKNTIIISSLANSWRYGFDSTLQRRIWRDIQVNEIMCRLKQSYRTLLTDYVESLGPQLRILRGKASAFTGKEDSIFYRPLELYLTLKVCGKMLRNGRRAKKLWQLWSKDVGFWSIFTYKGYFIGGLLKDQMRFLLHFYIPFAIYYIEGMREMIKRERPDLLILTPEAGLYGRAFCTAAKALKVPTLGIQHGVIYPTHPSYTHLKEDIAPNNEFINTTYCPMVDKIAVYGPYSRNTLIKFGNFPRNSVRITGAPRYDLLADPKKYFSKERVLKRLKVPKDKKIVVFASQTNSKQLSRADHLEHLDAIYTAVGPSSELQLVVKLHPHESPNLHYEVSKALRLEEKVIIVKHIDIYELLYSSDLLITLFSTVGFEAMILGKPVIVLNLTGEPDLVPFAQTGAAIGVYQKEELANAIKRCLYDDSTINELKENRKKFIYDQLYRIDGRATDRVFQLVQEMVGDR